MEFVFKHILDIFFLVWEINAIVTFLFCRIRAFKVGFYEAVCLSLKKLF